MANRKKNKPTQKVERKPRNLHDVIPTNFEDFINNEGVFALYFWGTNCGPCKSISPEYEKLAKINKGVCFGKNEVTADHAIATHMGVRRLPHLVVWTHGVVVYDGAMPQSLRRMQDVISEVGMLNPTSVKNSVQVKE